MTEFTREDLIGWLDDPKWAGDPDTWDEAKRAEYDAKLDAVLDKLDEEEAREEAELDARWEEEKAKEAEEKARHRARWRAECAASGKDPDDVIWGDDSWEEFERKSRKHLANARASTKRELEREERVLTRAVVWPIKTIVIGSCFAINPVLGIIALCIVPFL